MTTTPSRSSSHAHAAAHPPRPARSRRARNGYAVMLLGGLAGVVTASWQTLERIAWAADPDSLTVCEISAVVSCSSVFSHWQSSALGVPNSLVALPVFAMLATSGLAGVLGARFPDRYLRLLLGVTLGMTGFVVWYMQQSAFAIGVLCLFCLGCLVNIVVAGAGLTRVVAAEHALGRGRADRELGLLVASRSDLIAWAGVLLVVGAMLYVGLTG